MTREATVIPWLVVNDTDSPLYTAKEKCRERKLIVSSDKQVKIGLIFNSDGQVKIKKELNVNIEVAVTIQRQQIVNIQAQEYKETVDGQQRVISDDKEIDDYQQRGRK